MCRRYSLQAAVILIAMLFSVLCAQTTNAQAPWEWHNPLPQGNSLYGIWGSGPDDIFAVGTVGTVLHFDGSQWRHMESGTSITLESVWGSGPNDVYAAGWGGEATGLVIHYDGTRWSSVLNFEDADLHSVWGSGPNDVYVDSSDANIPYHFNGTRWRAIDYGVEIHTYGIGGSGPDDVHIGGQIHFDGESWQPVTGVWGSPMDIWGFAPDNAYLVVHDGRIYRFNGANWQKVVDTDVPMLAIWGSGPADVFCVGDNSEIAHYDGNQWEFMEAPYGGFLADVWGSGPDNVYAVGDSGTILHYDGSIWSSVDTGYRTPISDIWSSSPDDLFQVGWDGMIRHYDGVSWTEMNSGTTKHLESVWGFIPDDVFAVGWDGTVLHYDGSQWQAMASGTQNDLVSVWGNGPSDVYAVGYDISQGVGRPGSKTTIHFDGSAWTGFVPDGASGRFPWEEVWGTGPNDVFVVGAQGKIIHFDGNRWKDPSEWSDGTEGPLLGVHGTGPSDVYAVGSGDILYNPFPVFLHYDGTEWDWIRGCSGAIYDVWAAGPGDVYAVGSDGSVCHYDGRRLGTMWSNVQKDLYGVWGSEPENLYAVGDSGTLLTYSGGTPAHITGNPTIVMTDSTIIPYDLALTPNGNELLEIDFTLRMVDCVTLDPADANGDGVPDVVHLLQATDDSGGPLFQLSPSTTIVSEESVRIVIEPTAGNQSTPLASGELVRIDLEREQEHCPWFWTDFTRSRAIDVHGVERSLAGDSDGSVRLYLLPANYLPFVQDVSEDEDDGY